MALTNDLERYAVTARLAGCSADQVERFIAAGYVALPAMLPFHAASRQLDIPTGLGTPEILLDGTRGSAKSHATIAQVGIDDCQRRPGLKYIFLRKTQRAASESFEDLVARVLQNVPHKQNSERIEFRNGSRILIGGYNDDGDISKYIGIEYDGAVIEEATQIKDYQLDMFIGSIRTSRQDWIPRIYYSTNPGGLGHHYIKARFIDGVLPANRRRFFSSYKDNPFINPEYKAYLEGLTGDLAKAWRDGDWDVFAGQAFSAWRHDIHVIKPFEIPAAWTRWRAVDWGYSNPWCCLWLARNPDNGRIIVYREAYQTNLTDRQQAHVILDSTPPNERITVTYADPSMWASKSSGDVVTSTADVYQTAGVPLTRADNDRLSGKRKVDRLLEPLPDGLPGVQIFENCTNLIRTLPALAYDKTRVEDVDTHQEDHSYDAFRYGLSQAREYTPKVKAQQPPPIMALKGLVY